MQRSVGLLGKVAPFSSPSAFQRLLFPGTGEAVMLGAEAWQSGMPGCDDSACNHRQMLTHLQRRMHSPLKKWGGGCQKGPQSSVPAVPCPSSPPCARTLESKSHYRRATQCSGPAQTSLWRRRPPRAQRPIARSSTLA